MTEEELQELRDKAAAFDFLCSTAWGRHVRTERRIRTDTNFPSPATSDTTTARITYDLIHRYDAVFSWTVLNDNSTGFREAVLAVVKAQSARKQPGPR